MSLPFKSDAIEVVSGGAANPKVVAGTADPTVGFSAPEGSIYLRYGVGAGQAYVKSGVGDTNWGQVDAGGGGIGGTLDDAYDFGSPGGGRIIAADSGAVRIDAGTNDSQAALHIQRLPGGASAAVGIDLVLSSSVNASGVGIQITDPGSGTSLKVTKSAAGSVYFADLTNLGAKALEVVVTAAPTSVSPVSIVANTTGTTADLLSISKIPGGATAGNALSVSMGANTTGSGVYVSNVGTGAAIEVAAGFVSIAAAPGYALTAVTSSATLEVLRIRSTHASGISAIRFDDEAGVFKLGIGYANLDNVNYVDTQAADIVFTGIGIPSGIRMVAQNAIQMGDGSTAAVSAVSTGRLRYLTSTQRFQVSLNGAAYTDLATGSGMSIGATITGATVGSVLFVGAAGILQQDNANFFWDDTLNALVLTRNADIAPNLTIKNLHASGEAEVHFQNAAGTGKFSFGYANAGDDSYWFTNPGVPINIYTATVHRMRIAAASGNVGIGTGAVDAGYRLEVQNAGASQFHISNGVVDSGGYLTSTVATQMYISGGLAFDGTNLRAKATSASVVELISGAISFQTATGLTIGAISAMTERMLLHSAGGLEILNSDSATASLASRGKIRYTTSGQKMQLSHNTAGYFDIGTYAAALTTGSVPFANASNQLAQDNARLFWNDTNKALAVHTNHATDGSLFVRSTVTTGPSALGALDSTGAFKSYWGFFNSAYAFTYMQSKSGVLSFGGENIIFGNATIATHEFGMTAGSLFFEMFNGGSAAVSSANAGRFRYNTTGQKPQFSSNAGAYVDIELITVERHTGDGAANPAIKNTFVSGTGTDLTLADGTVDSFIKNFVITGGSGTITPANLADGNVLTWTTSPANVSFIWDATGATWHVYGNPYNMVTT